MIVLPLKVDKASRLQKYWKKCKIKTIARNILNKASIKLKTWMLYGTKFIIPTLKSNKKVIQKIFQY